MTKKKEISIQNRLTEEKKEWGGERKGIFLNATIDA